MHGIIVLLAPAITPETIGNLILALTAILGAPIIQVVKDQFGLEGKPAVVAASATSLLLGVLVAAVNGQFNGFDFSIESIGAAGAVIFSGATMIYKLLMGKKPDEDEDEEPDYDDLYPGE